ncbi:MAG: site-specific integrase [Chloroflexi bacterium]|nr:site-specific integrase [Chloroflexota bacterium]
MALPYLVLEELSAEREYLTLFFQSIRVSGGHVQRLQPLTEAEIKQIRDAIQPHPGETGEWVFPKNAFSPSTALRNWLMFEVAYELGLRRGELLKLRLDSLPRGHEESILVRRHPDDLHDSRDREPAVKTAERKLPASRNLLQALRHYITAPPPLGRIHGQSPYLFVTRQGNPVAIDTTQDIIRAIGKHSGIQPLSWHRLRHTWAERMAEVLLEQPNGMDILMYLGGWSHPESPKHYIQNALAKQSAQLLAQYQYKLYPTAEGVANDNNKFVSRFTTHPSPDKSARWTASGDPVTSLAAAGVCPHRYVGYPQLVTAGRDFCWRDTCF